MPLALCAVLMLSGASAVGRPPAIGPVEVPSAKATVNGVVELTFDVAANFQNPFDPAQIAVDAKIVDPNGAPTLMPGFYHQDYARKLEGGAEVLAKVGGGRWKVRFSPQKPGPHRVIVTVKTPDGMTTSTETTVVAEAGADNAPMIGISPQNERYFAYRGTNAPYLPLGPNMGWAGPRATYDFDDWLGALGAQGGTWARVWLAPGWSTFGFEEAGKPADGKGVGHYNLAKLWRLDQVLATARAKGVKLQLCIQSYNDLRDRDASNEWERSPWNAENGGPLRIWSDFWTDPKADASFRQKLRYLVARYAADSTVFAWEFWNEADLTRDYETARVRAWHERMIDALRELDPYRHLITTSFSNPMGDRAIDTLPGLDFVQTHSYNAPDPIGPTISQHGRKLSYGRPHFVAEIGADSNGPREKDDPKGLQIVGPMWASIASGQSGVAAPWWWDNYIAPRDLWPLFGHAARFLKGIDHTQEAFRIVAPALRYVERPTRPRYRDLNLEGGPVSWQPAAYNRPTRVFITEKGHEGGPISGVLHGVGNHPFLTNPVRFIIDLPRPTTMEIVVGDVSGYGGAKLAVELNGARVVTRDFADTDATNDTIRKYASVIRLPIPKGRHVVTVANPGRDWVYVSYIFPNAVATVKPPLAVYAVSGETTALAYLRRAGASWQALAVQKRAFAPLSGTSVAIPGLASGRWRVEFWNPMTGQVVATRDVEVRLGGVLRVAAPPIGIDLALKAMRIRKP